MGEDELEKSAAIPEDKPDEASQEAPEKAGGFQLSSEPVSHAETPTDAHKFEIAPETCVPT